MWHPEQVWEIFLYITPLRVCGAFILTSLLAYLTFRLQTKYFYFVRHGRTTLNEAGIKQGPDGSLSKAGKEQASKLGKALGEVEPKLELICSSPFDRAKETAAIINSYLHVPVSYTPLLAERKNPDEVIGKSVDDPEVQRITGLIEKGFHDDHYRFSNEENFDDLLKRAHRCLAYFAHRIETRMCVVTHHAFLQILLSYIHSGKKLDAKTYATLAFFNPSDNAAVTVCTYRPWKAFLGQHSWDILTYNQIIDA